MVGSGGSSATQLALPITAEPARAQVPGRIRPMLPGTGGSPFDDDTVFFEPWWPGTRCFAFLEGGRLRLQTEHLADPLQSFPELRSIIGQVDGDGVVLDGTLMVLDANGRPDTDQLRRRLAGSLAPVGEGAFVASDVLYEGGVDVTTEPFGARRARLLRLVRDGRECVVSRGLHGEGLTLADAVASMGLDAISARRLDGRWRPGPAGVDWQRIPVARHPEPEGRPLLVLLERLPLD
jgi:bifunctional non-homologous end joining protein LigD